MKRTNVVAIGSVVAIALVTALLYGLPASGQAAAGPEKARGYAYGASALGGEDPQLNPLPEREAVAPPPAPQDNVKRVSTQDTAVDTGIVNALQVQADACLDTGASAKLQFDINTARILARGGKPESDPDDVNHGPSDPDPERELVRYPAGFPDTARCVSPASGGAPVQGPTPTGTPTPAPTATPGSPPLCENVQTDPNKAGFSPVCLATSPLWNGRGYAEALDVLGVFEEVEGEAVARCNSNRELIVSSGADYDLTEVTGPASPDRPNQPLDPLTLGLVGVSAVTFWETNWDPKTNTTTDGSDTVWVNGLHIITSTGRDIIVSHAEATAECPAEPTPTPTPTETEEEPPPDIPAACRPSPGREPSGLIIIGTQGPDAIAGTERDDIICTLGGDDLVDGLDGADLIILGSGNDEAEGGGGKDTIHGEAGNDSINGGLLHDLLIGGDGSDQLKGNRGIDTLRGNDGADTLQGGEGDDVLRGGAGNDSLRGFNGNDLLNGDEGFDQCIPGRGRDRVRNCER